MAIAGRLRPLVALLHPVPSAATVLVALGLALPFRRRATVRRAGRRLALLGAMMATQQVAISLHNDWCDRDLDRVAKSWRALPSGSAAPGAVRAAAWAMAGLSLLAAAPGGGRLVLLDAAGAGAGFLYNARLKRTPLSWLPFAVAFPLLPLFGAAALGVWPRRWWTLFAVGGPAVVAVHLSDAIPDIAADARLGAGGLAVRLGAVRARRLCLAALAGSALLAGSIGLLRRDAPARRGAATALILALLAAWLPRAQRAAVPAGAAAVALGWVMSLARDPDA
jgi:4-hydroxybenzoate polyprenyltransferase